MTHFDEMLEGGHETPDSDEAIADTIAAVKAIVDDEPQQLYKVVINPYNKQAVETPPALWKQTLIYAEGASILANMVWTRHINVTDVIRHMDQYDDLFNEGTVKIVKHEPS